MSIVETIMSGAITGLGSGAGVAVGTYFANRAVIKHLDKLEAKLKKAN